MPNVQPIPVVVVPSTKPSGVTRLGTPAAFIMLIGLLFVYYAVRGWDAKYGTFNGTFAGAGSVPSGTRARAVAATVVPTVPSSSFTVGTVAAANTYSDEIATLRRYIANLNVPPVTTTDRQKIATYEARILEYQRR